MMRIIDYIWYRLYRGSLKSNLKRPRYLLASITLSVCLHANVIAISYTFFSLFNIPYIYSGCPDWGIPVVSVLLALFFFLIYRNGRGQKVYAKYRQESGAHKKTGIALTTIYFVLTGLLLPFLGGILRWLKYGYFPL